MRIKTTLMHHCQMAQGLEYIFRMHVKDADTCKKIQIEVDKCHALCSGVLRIQSRGGVTVTCTCECHK